MFSAIKAYFGHLLEVPDAVSPARYRSLRRIMTILMVTVSVTPLLILTGMHSTLAPVCISYFTKFQYDPLIIPACYIANFGQAAAAAGCCGDGTIRTGCTVGRRGRCHLLNDHLAAAAKLCPHKAARAGDQ